jgi:hypothetical protein
MPVLIGTTPVMILHTAYTIKAYTAPVTNTRRVDEHLSRNAITAQERYELMNSPILGGTCSRTIILTVGLNEKNLRASVDQIHATKGFLSSLDLPRKKFCSGLWLPFNQNQHT